MYQVEEEKMKHKVIVAMSLVAAGVMTYLMFSGLDEDFYHFPWEVFAGFCGPSNGIFYAYRGWLC